MSLHKMPLHALQKFAAISCSLNGFSRMCIHYQEVFRLPKLSFSSKLSHLSLLWSSTWQKQKGSCTFCMKEGRAVHTGRTWCGMFTKDEFVLFCVMASRRQIGPFWLSSVVMFVCKWNCFSEALQEPCQTLVQTLVTRRRRERVQQTHQFCIITRSHLRINKQRTRNNIIYECLHLPSNFPETRKWGNWPVIKENEQGKLGWNLHPTQFKMNSASTMQEYKFSCWDVAVSGTWLFGVGVLWIHTNWGHPILG